MTHVPLEPCQVWCARDEHVSDPNRDARSKAAFAAGLGLYDSVAGFA